MTTGRLPLPHLDINQDPVGCRMVRGRLAPPDMVYRRLLQKADISFRIRLLNIGAVLPNLHIVVGALVPPAGTGSTPTFPAIRIPMQRGQETTDVQEKAMSDPHERADEAHWTQAILEKAIRKNEGRLQEMAVVGITERLTGATLLGIEGAPEAERGALTIARGRANGNANGSATCTDVEDIRIA